MTKLNFRSLVFVALGTMMLSCSKDQTTPSEKPETLSETSLARERYSVLPPYNVGDPGKDPSKKLNFPNRPDNPWDSPKFPFQVIEKPTSDYLKETCLFDLSKLENNKTYHKLQNGQLTIGFFDPYINTPVRLLKLKSSAVSGWNANWGVSPLVESENPDVLYANVSNREDIVIYLSKPCIEFGFEIAPNHQNYSHTIDFFVGDWIYDLAKGYLNVEAKSPSGARLVSVKATKPFTMITVGSGDSPGSEIDFGGFAIANIRYKLAK